MPFVTTLTMKSGDRDALDGAVADLKREAERKGIDLRGPHPSPPDTYRVPLYDRADGGEAIGTWEYTVYQRRIELTGHDETVRRIAGRDLPRSVRVEVTVEQVRSTGS